jgi:hypothetical protein
MLKRTMIVAAALLSALALAAGSASASHGHITLYSQASFQGSSVNLPQGTTPCTAIAAVASFGEARSAKNHMTASPGLTLRLYRTTDCSDNPVILSPGSATDMPNISPAVIRFRLG